MDLFIFEMTTSESGLSSTDPPGPVVLLLLLKTMVHDLIFGLSGLAGSPTTCTWRLTADEILFADATIGISEKRLV